MGKKFILYFLLCLASVHYLHAQERVTTFGLQVKPIIPIQFFDAGKQEQSVNNIDYIVNPKLGMSFGMVIRKGFTNSLSLETGINFLRRNYDLTINDADSSFSGTSQFRLLTYEIPVLGLVYVRINRQLYMNAAGGISFDIYPTPLFTADTYFTNSIARTSWLQPSLLANVGWEYRTESSGYFYFGASLHRPFQKIYTEYIKYEGESGFRNEKAIFELTGNYITIDFRYFFHEDPEKRKKKTKKEPKVKGASR
ncbi:MAG: hypothetical protein KDD41_04150 [Flavobacteriales bacterium]|nr:hypothetical protein [Flavobacteriales bacterium]